MKLDALAKALEIVRLYEGEKAPVRASADSFWLGSPIRYQDEIPEEHLVEMKRLGFEIDHTSGAWKAET